MAVYRLGRVDNKFNQRTRGSRGVDLTKAGMVSPIDIYISNHPSKNPTLKVRLGAQQNLGPADLRGIVASFNI